MAKIIVTGASGFLASALIDALLAEGETVVGVTRADTSPESLRAARKSRDFTLAVADYDDIEGLTASFAGGRALVHCAGVLGHRPAPDLARAMLRANVSYVANVAEACRRASVARLIYVASSSCYGATAVFPTPEDAPPAPDSFYATSKHMGEEVALQYARAFNLAAISLRLSSVYGAPLSRMPSGSLVPTLIGKRDRGETIEITGTGEQTRDLVYIDDVVRACLAAIATPVPGGVFNVGSGVETSLNELCALLDCAVRYAPARPGEMARNRLDIRRAADTLGWRPAVDLRAGLRRVDPRGRAA